MGEERSDSWGEDWQIIPQGIANLMWAFGRVEPSDGGANRALRVLCKELKYHVGSFQGIDFSHCLWALATACEWNDVAFSTLTIGLMKQRHKCSEQHVMSIAWAWASYCDAIESTQFEPKDRDIQVLGFVIDEMQSKMTRATPQALALTAWAMATVRLRGDDFLANARETFWSLRFNGHDLANIAWSSATLGGAPASFFCRGVAACTPEQLPTLTLQGTLNILWSLAVADAQEADTGLLIRHLHRQSCDAQELDWRQIHQSALGLRMDVETLWPRAAKAWLEKRGLLPPKSSALHHEVSHALTRLGLEHDMEVANAIAGDIDIVVAREPSGQIAIEVDGPAHFVFIRNGSYTPNGSTVLKRRLLTKAGYKVRSVLYLDWPRDRSDQEDYLLKLIDEGRQCKALPRALW